jgi:Arc/MetJ family transcription regulator
MLKRFNIDINRKLLNEVMRVSGASTKSEAVTWALQLHLRVLENERKQKRECRIARFYAEVRLAAESSQSIEGSSL